MEAQIERTVSNGQIKLPEALLESQWSGPEVESSKIGSLRILYWFVVKCNLEVQEIIFNQFSLQYFQLSV